MPMPPMPGAAAQLVMPMPIMIWLAVLVEAAIGNWVDMLILLLIQFVNAFIAWCAPADALPPPPAARCGLAVREAAGILCRVRVRVGLGMRTALRCGRRARAARRYETTKAGDAVRALKASRPQATARRDGVWQTLDAAALVPGDLVLLASGSHVPADCKARAARARACRRGLPQLVARATEHMSREPLPPETLPRHMHGGSMHALNTTVLAGKCTLRLAGPGRRVQALTLPWPPMAGQVVEGTVDVDQSALTGESLPVTLRAGEPAMMGGTIVRGEVRRARARGSRALWQRLCLSAGQASPANVVRVFGSAPQLSPGSRRIQLQRGGTSLPQAA